MRDNSEEQHIAAIMTQQISRQERLKRADDIINNNETLEELQLRITQYHHQLLKTVNNQQNPPKKQRK